MMAITNLPSSLTEREHWRQRGEQFILLAQKLFREHEGPDRESRLGLALQRIEFRAFMNGYEKGRRDSKKQMRVLMFVGLMVGIAVGFLLA